MSTNSLRTPAELPLQLDRAADASLPVQLAAALRDEIDAGRLRPGEGVPATRALASRLGVARGVVVTAYEQLVAEGYLRAEHGRGTAVNPDLGALGGQPRAAFPDPSPNTGDADRATPVGAEEPPLRPPLAPGTPLTDVTERPAWRAAWRDAVRVADRRQPALGDPRLRHEIAEHLRLMRGTSRSVRDVIVTAGAREGLGLLLTALGTTRGNGLVVGVEDPGYPSLRGVAARHGARIVSLPVDADGLRTSALPAAGMLDLVIVTPSHQYPVGGSLPLPRRRELLDWAARTGVIVVEDDYDSELRHSGGPLPALAALDDPLRGSVVTLGTFSSTISPALAAGFLLAPENLRALLEPVRLDLGSPVSSVVQLALADYLASGELRRNIARVRRRHSARRDRISARFAGVPGVRVRPMSGGLHAVLELTAPPGGAGRAGGSGAAATTADRAPGSLAPIEWEAAVVARAAEPAPRFPAGLGVAALGDYWQHRRPDRTAGIVLGMGGPDDAEFADAIERLREVLTPS
ncbi:PLP-dependent aminotransferase family protein [Leucobacter ruminantium]|uniref:MocR-like pyridoxine biosynthesis transcription factor PdxR n=1 Tax=Leucobacter ruminantium TaxID=1289170 RepID=UPI003132CFCC